MVGIPLFFDLALIWGPTIVSIFLSFTNWNGIGSPLDAKNFIGLKNYENLFTGTYPFFWPALQHNLLWLAFLMFIATPLGIFLAVLLDREIRGTRFYQTRLLPAGRALARGHRHHLAASVRARAGFINNVLRARRHRRTSSTGSATRNLNLWAALVAASWRHVGYIMVLYLAGLKSVRPDTPRGGQGRRRERAPDLLPGRLPGHAADQRRHRRHHDDRGAARVRHRLHHQPEARTASSCCRRSSPTTASANRAASASARPSPSSCSSISLVPIVTFLTRQLREEPR